ncbi:MAG TPA: TIGR03067 domain-containing protein [Gemmata sp.]|jgi:uncharacterized protein (TIGR03067 family)|nr:TIGR03067 domain-containing protein [Gemmata sp.]
MISSLLMLLLTTTTIEPPQELSKEAQKEVKKLEGKWQVQKEITVNGETDRSDDPNGAVEFKERTVVIRGMEVLEIASLDLSTDPKCIDLKITKDFARFKKGDVLETIYKLDGDTLTMALYEGEGNKRPTNLDPPKNPGTALIIMKRVKE